jgi:cytochrome b561
MSVRWLRWVAVALGVAIGAVLVLSRHWLIGVLILALALVRASVLVTVRKRRAAFRTRRADWLGSRRY